MRPEKEFNEEEYIEWLNHGYYLSKYAPEMADLIVHAKGDTSKLNALQDGRNIYLDEEFEELKPDWLTKDDFDNNDEKEKGLDKDNEPEM